MSAQVRIAAGSLRGRSLAVPVGVRPTAARVRESLMNIWQSRIPGARVLDLFGGSGAVGIEALSRGAASVLMIDVDANALRQLRATLEELELWDAKVLPARLPECLARPIEQLSEPFDLMFADPPYEFDSHEDLLRLAAPRLAPGGELCLEHDSKRAVPGICGDLIRVDERRYGDSCLSFFRLVHESQG